MTCTHQRVVVHVGTPKSGTTYLQNLMWHSRASLLEAGLLYPGDHAEDHFRAAVDLHNDGYLHEADPAVPGAWSRLVEAAQAHPGTTVITQELLGDHSAEDAARALATLDFAEVHLVVTVRDLARQLPAAWQEDLKNRHHVDFPEWLDAVRPGTDRDEWYGRAFWRRQDVPALLDRWGADLPADRVHVVTVPPRGGDPALLWERFASVLGVDPRAGSPAGPPNKSLGRVEAELIRRLNERADYSVEWPLYASRVTAHMAGEFLPERAGSVPLSLPAAERSWVAARAEAMIADLTARRYHVVGHLAELRVDPTAGPPPTQPVTESQLLDAALDAMVALLRLEGPACCNDEAIPVSTDAVDDTPTEPAGVDVPLPADLPLPVSEPSAVDHGRPAPPDGERWGDRWRRPRPLASRARRLQDAPVPVVGDAEPTTC